MDDNSNPDALAVTLPFVQKPGEPMDPPMLVYFGETRPEKHAPHMYQARVVISSIDGIPQDPASPPRTDAVLDGDHVAAFAGKVGGKLWFLFGKYRPLQFKLEALGHRYRFAVQLWACWYDKSSRGWDKAFYQGEVETEEILCGMTTEWPGKGDTLSWDCEQVQSILAISEREPPANILEMTSNFPQLSLHPDLFQGPWASPNRPKPKK